MRSVPRDFRKYVKAAVEQGWEFRRCAKHNQLYPPKDSDAPIVSVPKTSGDRRAVYNKVAQLRRAGVKLPH